MGRRLTICTWPLALALAVGGCGGGDDQSGAEAWAEDACSAINTWADEVEQSRAALADPTNLSVDSFKDEIDSVVTATEALADDVRGLGRPDTEAGAEAEEQVAQLADELDAQGQILSDAMATDADTLDQLLGKVSVITGAVSTMISSARTTFEAISQLEGAAELESAFESADTCDQVRSTLEQTD